MGWTTTHKTPGQPLIRFFEREFNYDNETRSGKILLCKAHVYQREVYMAYQVTNKQSGQTDVIGLVCKIQFHPKAYHHNFSYKDMSEDMGPLYSDCPESILNLLTPTDNKRALAWRQKCRQRLNKPPLRTDSIIRFENEICFKNHSERYKVFKVVNARKLLFKVAGQHGFYRISRRLLNHYKWEVLDPKRAPEEELPLMLGLHPSLDAQIADRLNPPGRVGKCPVSGEKCKEYKNCHEKNHCHLK